MVLWSYCEACFSDLELPSRCFGSQVTHITPVLVLNRCHPAYPLRSARSGPSVLQTDTNHICSASWPEPISTIPQHKGLEDCMGECGRLLSPLFKSELYSTGGTVYCWHHAVRGPREERGTSSLSEVLVQPIFCHSCCCSFCLHR